MARCAFSLPLVAGHFGCRCAVSVTRRGGPDVDCAREAAAARCASLLERLKAAGLPAFGVDDDPASMPHSVLVKIQHGALAGLQAAIDGDHTPQVADIDGLLDRAIERAGGVDAIDCASLVPHMTGWRVRRR